MSQISQFDEQITQALERLRGSIEAKAVESAARPESKDLETKFAELERENTALASELENLRAKRDKDVSALDELIAQLKPLIEEV